MKTYGWYFQKTWKFRLKAMIAGLVISGIAVGLIILIPDTTADLAIFVADVAILLILMGSSFAQLKRLSK